jgi:hypothetical protein
MNNVRFTEHAIERFIERVMPQASKVEAIEEMNKLVSSGSRLREKNLAGDHCLVVDGVVFVLKFDRNDGFVDCPTVLFDRRTDSNPLAQEIETFGSVPNYVVEGPRYRKKSKRSRKSQRW